uniref:Baculoviral IAP repeat containing 5 n=1 Tax=Eptatretus burgeri TaxID=7764 RepID=A0A8C4ND10_EPTBU
MPELRELAYQERLRLVDIFYKLSKRLSSFKDWPFLEDCSCTPQKMAEAGFVHQACESEPDVVICFFCFKELDGWEPDDNPWSVVLCFKRKQHFSPNIFLVRVKPLTACKCCPPYDLCQSSKPQINVSGKWGGEPCQQQGNTLIGL